MLMLAEGYADPNAGPGRLIGLLVAALLCFLYWRFDPKRDRGEGGAPPSPTDGAPPAPREIAQVGGVSSQAAPETVPVETGAWYGRMEKVNGTMRRVYETARHVAATGDSPPPDGVVPDDVVPDDRPMEHPASGDDETEFDLALDDEAEVPAPPIATRMETREEFTRRCIKGGVAEPQIAAALQKHYGISRATAYRTIRAERPAGPRKVA